MFEIGNSLREARTRRKIELAQAEQATKIRGKYLRALEDEQFDLLPAQTYVKGFLRTYADYLGLDGQLYVDEYNSRFVVGEDWDRRRPRGSAAQRQDRRLQGRVVLAALAVVTVLTVVVISAWKVSGGSRSVPPPANARAAKHRAAAPASYLELTAVRGPSKVIVNRASAGGRILFEGTLERGETQAFAGKRFWLNVGAPENLEIRVGGKRVHVTGYRPWVLTVTPSGWHGHPA
ncbi:MAG TPA: helix-turn-helix domain-containing protein [Gaiellaceae bacterium]|nr:helix-turn-helix domain-containing protein [Gaiellaceae bacterium]